MKTIILGVMCAAYALAGFIVAIAIVFQPWEIRAIVKAVAGLF